MSALALGTVQLGCRYGVNNAIGRQPTMAEAHAVLTAALDAGIEVYDTAAAYGSAEEVLGAYHLAGKNARIISKLKPDCEDSPTAVLAEIRGSLGRLGGASLYGYMLHRAADRERAGVMAGMVAAREQGLTAKIGVSIYEPAEALAAAADPRVDIIQIPYNVLDYRLDEAGFFDLARENGIEVYARSAFLQGLLLMDPAAAETRVPGSGELVREFQSIAAAHGFTPVEAAMLYSLSHSGIDYVVFGVDTREQLEANTTLASRLADFTACCTALHGHFRGVKREIIVPSLW